MGIVVRGLEPTSHEAREKGAVARLVRRWEDKLLQKTQAAGTLSLTAVSLSACGDGDEGGDSDADPAAFQTAVLENVAGSAAELFVPWFGLNEDDDDAEEDDSAVEEANTSKQATASDSEEKDVALNEDDGRSVNVNDDDEDDEDDDEGSGSGFPDFDNILAQLFSNFGTPSEGALTAGLLTPKGPIVQADFGLTERGFLGDDDFLDSLEDFFENGPDERGGDAPPGFQLPGDLTSEISELFDEGVITPDMFPEMGFKVWRLDPSGHVQDLTDGDGDPGRGLGDPSNRYPWSFESFDGALFVGAMNSNPFPINLISNLAGFAASGFNPLEYPGYPTTYTKGPEIWRWMPDALTPAAPAIDLEVAQVPSPDGGTWQQVFDASDLPDLDGQVGIRELHAHDDDYLYAATSNTHVPLLIQSSQDRASLIRTMDGENWDFVPTGPGFDDDPFDNPGLSSIRTLESHHGKLFVGTEVGSALFGLLSGEDNPLDDQPDFLKPGVWFFEEGGDSSPWTQVIGQIDGLAVSEMLSFMPTPAKNSQTIKVSLNDIDEGTQLFFGTYGTEGLKLYEVSELKPEVAQPLGPLFANGDNSYEITDVSPMEVSFIPGLHELTEVQNSYVSTAIDLEGPYDSEDFGDTSPFDDFGVLKLFEFDGYMYLSGVDYFDGATLMRTMNPSDPTSWEILTADGFVTELGEDAGAANPPIGPSFNIPTLKGNFYFWSATVVVPKDGDPTLYVGSFNGVAGEAQVFEITHEGEQVNVENVTEETIGSAESIYGVRSAETLGEETVFFGGASNGVMPDFFSDPYPATFDV